MNASQFSIKELQIAIPILLKKGKGITALTCMGMFREYIDCFYPELSFKEEFEIDAADEINGDVSINFSQEFYLDEESNEGFNYETIQSAEDIKQALNEQQR